MRGDVNVRNRLPKASWAVIGVLGLSCLDQGPSANRNVSLAGRVTQPATFLVMSRSGRDTLLESAVVTLAQVIDGDGSGHQGIAVAHEPWSEWNRGDIKGASGSDTLQYVGETDSVSGMWSFGDGGRWLVMGIVGGGEISLCVQPCSESPASIGVSGKALSEIVPSNESLPMLGDVVEPIGGAIALRVDDAAGDDSMLINYALDRDLPVEAAIPTARVGVPGYLTWEYLERAVPFGLTTAAHSRHHSTNPLTMTDAVTEVLGARLDLESRGLPGGVFVVPGTWSDTFGLLSTDALGHVPARLFSGAAALVEGQVPLAYRPIADSEGWGEGRSHFSADGQTLEWLEAWTDETIARGYALEFDWHAGRSAPATLRSWFDYLAAKRDSGRLLVLSVPSLAIVSRTGAPHRLLLWSPSGPTGAVCEEHGSSPFDGSLDRQCQLRVPVEGRRLGGVWELSVFGRDATIQFVTVAWPTTCGSSIRAAKRLYRSNVVPSLGRTLLRLRDDCYPQYMRVGVDSSWPHNVLIDSLVLEPE